MLALQRDLTDAMITEAIERHNNASMTVLVAAMVMIAVFVLLVVLKPVLRSIKARQNGEETERKRTRLPILIIPMVVLFGICGFMVFHLSGNIKQQQELEANADSWHVVETTIASLDRSEKTTKTKKKNGKYKTTTTTYYSAVVNGYSDACSLSASEYSSLSEGEAVYAVIDYRDHVLYIYSTEDYSYTGSRLK